MPQAIKLPIEIEKRKKIEIITKFLILIVLSNFFTFLIFSHSPEQSKAKVPTLRSGHIKLFLPIKSLFIVPKDSQVVATILDKKNHVIFKKVYLKSIDGLVQEDNFSYLQTNNKEIQKYEVEISQTDFKKIKNPTDRELFAVPYESDFKEDYSDKSHSLEFNF